MADPDFPDTLCSFIQTCTPSVEAVELLLLLVRDPARAWEIRALHRALLPTTVADAALRDYLAGFLSHGLVQREGESWRATAPLAPPLDEVVQALTKAYNERPVSLVRMIYILKDKKIQSFAEAFRIRKG